MHLLSSPPGLGASAWTDDPYLLMPRGSTPTTPSNVPLLPAFPLYAVTPIGSSISLSAFNIGLTPSFASAHLIMASPLVSLVPDDAAQSLQAGACGGVRDRGFGACHCVFLQPSNPLLKSALAGADGLALALPHESMTLSR